MTTATETRPALMRARSVESLRGRYLFVNHATNDECEVELTAHRGGTNDGDVSGLGPTRHVWQRQLTPRDGVLSIFNAEGRLCCLELCPDGVLRGRLDNAESYVDPTCELIPLDPPQPATDALEAEPPELTDYMDVKVRTGQLGQQDRDVVNEVIVSDGYRLSIRPTKATSDEVVIDAGAHIGTFALMWHKKNPLARIICVEACPENLAVLRANVGHFATVIHAALSYSHEPLALLNSVNPGPGTATGGSIVVSRAELDRLGDDARYRKDFRPLRSVTLEDVMRQCGVDHIDVLKLDIEGSEFDTLEHSPTVPTTSFICGEYHGRARWDELRQRKFRNWGYALLHATGGDDGLGLFHLQRP